MLLAYLYDTIYILLSVILSVSQVADLLVTFYLARERPYTCILLKIIKGPQNKSGTIYIISFLQRKPFILGTTTYL